MSMSAYLIKYLLYLSQIPDLGGREYTYLISFFFKKIYGCTCSIWGSPGQRLNLSRNSPQQQHQILNSLRPKPILNSLHHSKELFYSIPLCSSSQVMTVKDHEVIWDLLHVLSQKFAKSRLRASSATIRFGQIFFFFFWMKMDLMGK